MPNLFDLPRCGGDGEALDLLASARNIRVERIVSTGQASPPGFWYDQDLDEWVALLTGEATLLFEGGGEVRLRAGDWLLIKAHEKHRVEWTSSQPPCVWLAVHATFT